MKKDLSKEYVVIKKKMPIFTSKVFADGQRLIKSLNRLDEVNYCVTLYYGNIYTVNKYLLVVTTINL